MVANYNDQYITSGAVTTYLGLNGVTQYEQQTAAITLTIISENGNRSRGLVRVMV